MNHAQQIKELNQQMQALKSYSTARGAKDRKGKTPRKKGSSIEDFMRGLGMDV